VSQVERESPRGALPLAVGLTACGVLVLEIGLTRILSVLLRFHFVFLVISAAILGFGLGGMLSVSSVRRLRERVGDRKVLVLLATAAALSIPLSLAALFRTPLSQHIFNPLTVPAVSVLPFLLCGVFLSYAFDRSAAEAGRLYFADLGGAAAGALAVILLLNALGGVNASLAASLFLLAAALALAWGGSLRQRVVIGVLGLACLGLVLGNVGERWIGLGAVRFDRLDEQTAANVKPLFSPQELGNSEIGSKIVATDWNAFARTDVVSNRGDSTLFVYTDGDVPTNMLRFDGTRDSVVDATELIGFAGLVAGPRESVLFIGPGGGLDIHMGALAGAGDMVGVELNPSIPRLMSRFREHNGSVYAMEGVRLHVDEGRSFIRREKRSYDVIYTALTKTATTQTSGLTLVESHVFTVEAFRDYLDHLAPGGRLVVVLDRETIVRRAMLTAIQALMERGESPADASRHCAMFALPRAQKTLEVLGEIAEKHGIPRATIRSEATELATSPSLWWTSPYAQLLVVTKEPMDRPRALTLERTMRRPWLDRQSLRARAHAQDPFLDSLMPGYLQLLGRGKVTDQEIEQIVSTRVEEMAGLATLYLPFVREQHEGMQVLSGPQASVEQYAEGRAEGNLLPVRDDQPFFLDLARGANPLLMRLLYLPGAAFALVLLLLAVTVAGRLRQGSGGVRESAVAFGYFGLLGIGFMLIEVPLTQKLVLFLGYPTLTLSVVIFSLLLGGGLGSLWSQRRAVTGLAATVQAAALAVAALGAVHALLVPHLLEAALGLPVFARSLMAVALVMPLGAALGVPFPSGLRLSAVTLPGMTPRLWGVNGILSTAGTVFAMLAGRYLGFTRTLLIGCGVYLLVVLVARHMAAEPAEADVAPVEQPAG
jgi:hypothetical protein